ncbi:MAG: DEAD/DEAH box helicase, partial [Desulfovibrionaceae bacterium]|nr:DEAD/DEAH box helicase [Desulfovibrionaceae bacterium]
MSVGEYIRALLASERFGGQVTHHRLLPEQGAVYGEPLRPWSGAVAGILERRGIAALFCHQAEAADRIRAGRHVVVATPTASGKSLIYNLPVIEQHVSDPDARALYLFPLKALARDQAAGFR